jgi:hypothetical protein
VGDYTKLAASVLWLVLQCHVQMQVLLEQGLQDHPIMTGEIGHFMLGNLNFNQRKQIDDRTLQGFWGCGGIED